VVLAYPDEIYWTASNHPRFNPVALRAYIEEMAHRLEPPAQVQQVENYSALFKIAFDRVRPHPLSSTKGMIRRYQPSLRSVSQICSTTSPRLLALSEESSPHA
jgi:hypothetical protein